MQRKRSYVEAMAEGSVYDLLEASNFIVTGAFNTNLNPNNVNVPVKSASAENLIDPRIGDIDFTRSGNLSGPIHRGNSASVDGVIQDLSSHFGGNMNRNNDHGAGDRDLHIHIENDDAVIELRHPNSSANDVNKLIDEVYNNCAEYMLNEEVIPRNSGFVSADRILSFNASDLKKVISQGGGDGGQAGGSEQDRRGSSSSEGSATNRQYSKDDELSDDQVSRETRYESDDNILEFDGEANEIVETAQRGMHRVNSLVIPNNAMSENSGSTIVPCLYTGRNSSRKFKRTQENGGFRARRSKRVVFKNGATNIPKRQHITGLVGKFMKDIVTTLIESRWRWVILLFAVMHFLLWLSFGLMFYLASYANGDMSESPGDIPCIENGNTFTGIFTFSVETQVSIGYGEKSPTEECPETIFIMVMEVVAGYVVVGGMVGIVYAKIVRPKNLDGVGFSRRAVVCMRDGRLCLLFRVWDVQQKHAVGTRASGWLVQHSGPRSTSLKLSPQNPLVLWPTTLEHVIDHTSPLYDWSAKDFVDQRFEVVVTLTGSSRLSGQMTQSRTSYLPSDILWGQRFKKVLSYNAQKGAYVVDHKSLNKVTQVDSPLCSARLLRELTSEGPASPLFRSTPSSPPSTLTSPGWSFRKQFKPLVARTAS